ncbi:MAG: FAD-dependent oxidoreductase [Erysipelotrichaceae bacterium]|uniref:NAD(P)/FAD-dependent oxidoreductase n=1 Tax=Floccifex sp. TaxID=2815810 RepID=UPI002A74BA64|nr:FAD-dependent oxidoreductase [Floccifex sp.]MDD7281571.1 FAD-dependent oxidoreductase [Erysipelotrichaceae bacterium]MDY2958452.1 FAD-dependent oxidoreductase [Floccifex sp.]
MKYDVAIIGAGPGGIYSAYELATKSNLSIAIFDAGHTLNRRKCPIDGNKITNCINCKSCSIMNGFGGAGAFSDGKYNITNDFGGTLYEYIGKEKATELMKYVDDINMEYGGQGTKMYSTAGSNFKKICMQNKLQLLDASVRHLGTDVNYIVLENLYNLLKDKVDFYFDTPIEKLEVLEQGYRLYYKDQSIDCDKCIVSVGRSGSKWMERVCENLQIPTKSNRVDLGVRVELPAVIFSHLTDQLYESKIVYRTEKFEDKVRTFCMNPNGIVVSENTNGIITVNGHSFNGEDKKTDNTNFALLVSKQFSEPFKDSNGYGESIARLSNMLGGGVIVQRFGDLERGRRSTVKRIEEGMVRPTLKATPGDLSLVLPKRILDGIIEMIHALDKIAPGTANDDTLLYGVEVKFYNMEVDIDENLETKYKGLYVIGDGSGVTHSLSHASASGVYVARNILNQE